MLLLLAMGRPDRASAQSISLSLVQVPLEEALTQLTERTGVDIVYAERLVDRIMVSCSYAGEDVSEALSCILSGTRLEARSTGPLQFVLLAEEGRRRRAISGFVQDAETGTPLPGAHVFLSDRTRGVITNRTGYFAFPSLEDGLYLLRVSFIGFEQLDTLVSPASSTLRFRLHPQPFETEPILVEEVEPRPGDHNLLTGVLSPPVRYLQRLPASLGGKDLLEALSWLPGIRRAGEVTGGLVVRGAGPDQNLYLIDGAPVYHPWHAFSLISTFQTETFRSVRLYRGAFPAEFGGRLSAVLDAELSDGQGAEPTASAAINTHSGRFLIEAPITPRSSFMFGGRRSYIDRLIGRKHPVSDDLGRRDTLRTGYFFYDWTAKLVFRPDQASRVSITSYTGRDELDLRLPFDLSLDLSSWLRPTDLLFEVGEFWRNRVISTRYERVLSTRWYLTATAHSTRYQAREAAFLRPTLDANVRSDYGVDIREVGLRVELDHFQSVQSELRVGGQVVARDFDSEVEALVQHNRDLSELLQESSRARAVEASGYMQGTWRTSRRIQLTGGLRAVAFGSDRLLRLAPRGSVQWTGHPRLFVVRASAGRSYQYLHRIRDRHSFLYDIVSSRWIPSGSGTSPARGTEYALAVESHPGNWDFQSSVYWREQAHVLLPRDIFQSKDQLTGPGIEIGTLLGQYVAGEAKASGFEASASRETARTLLSLAVTAERSLTRSPSVGELTFTPARFDVPRSVRMFGARRMGDWTASLGFSIRSGYPITVPTARYDLTGPVSDEATTYLHRPTTHNGRLPTYWRADASVDRTFRWLDAEWRVRLQVYNLTGHRNVIDRLYEPTETGVSTTNRRGLPILPLFELEVQL